MLEPNWNGRKMRIAVLSDIHGNIDALEVCLKSARDSGCSELFITGDLVGYYYDIDSVMSALSKFTYSFVLGNHEVMLRELLEDPSLSRSIRAKYGSALEVALTKLTSSQVEFLCSSPTVKSLRRGDTWFNLSHGSPWLVNEYLYPDTKNEIWEKFLQFDDDVFIIGNTHHQMLKRIRGKLIINPGSVGQSRTDKSHAQWAEIDSSTLEVSFKSVAYDSTRLRSKCQELDPGLEILTGPLLP
jgi:predicted phosphodiesterase